MFDEELDDEDADDDEEDDVDEDEELFNLARFLLLFKSD